MRQANTLPETYYYKKFADRINLNKNYSQAFYMAIVNWKNNWIDLAWQRNLNVGIVENRRKYLVNSS